MDVWKIYAYISNGTVKGIGLFPYDQFGDALRLAKLVCEDENAFEVDVTHIPVQENDTYANGVFYRNGVAIEPFPTVDEELEEHSSAIDDLWVAVLEG